MVVSRLTGSEARLGHPVNSTLTLRPYQLAGIEHARELIRQGHRRILLVLSTGGGKTACASAIIAGAIGKGKRALFVAPRREIVSQSFWSLVRAGVPEDQLGVIMADGQIVGPDNRPYRAHRPGAPTQVASWQTLSRRVLPPADVVFFDEAHHLRSASQDRLAVHYHAAGAVTIGLTATPVRADGKGLGAHFDVLHTVATFRELASAGYLCVPRVLGAAVAPDLTGVRTLAGDYAPGDLELAMDRPRIVADIVEQWIQHAEGRSTVVFASGVSASQHLAEAFVAAGVRAEHLDGSTPRDARDAILARLASGETTVASNSGVLMEGWDCPRVKCVVLARPTKSLGLYLQMAGRGLRPYEGVSALLMDHGECVAKADGRVHHGWPQDDRTWSLGDRPKRKGGGAVAKKCPECHAMVPGAVLKCPHCDYDFPPRMGPAHVDGELVEVIPPADRTATERSAWYASVLEEAVRRGYAVGWARHKYREWSGAWPHFYALERLYYRLADAVIDSSDGIG